MGLAGAFLIAGILHGVDPALLSSLCFVESGHKASAVSPHDGGSASYGLCQVKLATARGLGFKGKPAELLDPRVNAFYAAKLLAYHKRRYGTWDKAVSAFNCGRVCNNGAYVRRVKQGVKHGLPSGL